VQQFNRGPVLFFYRVTVLPDLKDDIYFKGRRFPRYFYLRNSQREGIKAFLLDYNQYWQWVGMELDRRLIRKMALVETAQWASRSIMCRIATADYSTTKCKRIIGGYGENCRNFLWPQNLVTAPLLIFFQRRKNTNRKTRYFGKWGTCNSKTKKHKSNDQSRYCLYRSYYQGCVV